jgi:nucleotide-binding universal stress UspA family protein
MPAIRRILCPLDFSRFSRHALEQAVSLAREFGAEISALHVVPHASILEAVPGRARAAIGAAGLSAASRAALTAELREFTYEVEAGGVVIHAAVDDGDPVETIAREADAWPADVIVMGTHGRTGVGRLLLGSVAERVLRLAPCPVVTVPRDVRSPAWSLTFGRLLCPIDFSAASARALDYAASLAAPEGPGLCVLHVVDLFAESGVAPDPAAFDSPDFAADVVRTAAEQVSHAVQATVRARCPVTEVAALGQASAEIVRVAAEQECDAIVLGVRRRSKADLLLYGSTIQEVVRHARVPVLTIRA